MGTPEFAVESLKNLVENNYNVVGVVLCPINLPDADIKFSFRL